MTGLVNTVTIGVLYASKMPYSEVCCHLKINGKIMLWRLLPQRNVVQLYTLPKPGDLREFSSPITPGEAGLMDIGEFTSDGERYYFTEPYMLLGAEIDG